MHIKRLAKSGLIRAGPAGREVAPTALTYFRFPSIIVPVRV